MRWISRQNLINTRGHLEDVQPTVHFLMCPPTRLPQCLSPRLSLSLRRIPWDLGSPSRSRACLICRNRRWVTLSQLSPPWRHHSMKDLRWVPWEHLLTIFRTLDQRDHPSLIKGARHPTRNGESQQKLRNRNKRSVKLAQVRPPLTLRKSLRQSRQR